MKSGDRFDPVVDLKNKILGVRPSCSIKKKGDVEFSEPSASVLRSYGSTTTMNRDVGIFYFHFHLYDSSMIVTLPDLVTQAGFGVI